ncbi:unnamed protein product, partial [Discosporangium mesarthrocarpum]
ADFLALGGEGGDEGGLEDNSGSVSQVMGDADNSAGDLDFAAGGGGENLCLVDIEAEIEAFRERVHHLEVNCSSRLSEGKTGSRHSNWGEKGLYKAGGLTPGGADKGGGGEGERGAGMTGRMSEQEPGTGQRAGTADPPTSNNDPGMPIEGCPPKKGNIVVGEQWQQQQHATHHQGHRSHHSHSSHQRNLWHTASYREGKLAQETSRSFTGGSSGATAPAAPAATPAAAAAAAASDSDKAGPGKDSVTIPPPPGELIEAVSLLLHQQTRDIRDRRKEEGEGDKENQEAGGGAPAGAEIKDGEGVPQSKGLMKGTPATTGKHQLPLPLPSQVLGGGGLDSAVPNLVCLAMQLLERAERAEKRAQELAEELRALKAKQEEDTHDQDEEVGYATAITAGKGVSLPHWAKGDRRLHSVPGLSKERCFDGAGDSLRSGPLAEAAGRVNSSTVAGEAVVEVVVAGPGQRAGNGEDPHSQGGQGAGEGSLHRIGEGTEKQERQTGMTRADRHPHQDTWGKALEAVERLVVARAPEGCPEDRRPVPRAWENRRQEHPWEQQLPPSLPQSGTEPPVGGGRQEVYGAGSRGLLHVVMPPVPPVIRGDGNDPFWQDINDGGSNSGNRGGRRWKTNAGTDLPNVDKNWRCDKDKDAPYAEGSAATAKRSDCDQHSPIGKAPTPSRKPAHPFSGLQGGGTLESEQPGQHGVPMLISECHKTPMLGGNKGYWRARKETGGSFHPSSKGFYPLQSPSVDHKQKGGYALNKSKGQVEPADKEMAAQYRVMVDEGEDVTNW